MTLVDYLDATIIEWAGSNAMWSIAYSLKTCSSITMSSVGKSSPNMIPFDNPIIRKALSNGPKLALVILTPLYPVWTYLHAIIPCVIVFITITNGIFSSLVTPIITIEGINCFLHVMGSDILSARYICYSSYSMSLFDHFTRGISALSMFWWLF